MIKYRNADISDIEIIKELAVKLCSRESEKFDNKYDWNNPLTDEWSEMIFFALKSKDYIVIIVEDDDKAIWFMIWWISKSLYYWKFDKLSELHKLFVDEKYRWKGIWENLMKKFIDFSVKNKVDRMEIYTFYENEVNTFYEKFWFEKKALFLRKDLT